MNPDSCSKQPAIGLWVGVRMSHFVGIALARRHRRSSVKRLATSGRYAACALVVDGGIFPARLRRIDRRSGAHAGPARDEYSGVLSRADRHHFHDHDEHRSFLMRHFAVNGEELADVTAKSLTATV